jgi:DNA-damage-inducible protein J
MARAGYLNTKIDESLKEEVHAIFHDLGMTPGNALTLLYTQIKLHRGFPFEVRMPNAETQAAMLEDVSNQPVYKSTKALFDSWDD